MRASKWFQNGLCLSLVCVVSVAGCNKDKKPEEHTQSVDPKMVEDLPDGLTPEQASKVVAKVGERTITVGDVTRQINRLSPFIRRRWAAPEKRKEFLDKLIRVELLSQEAERLGLDKDPEVQRAVKQMMVRMMITSDLEKSLLPTEIEEALLKAEFEKNLNKFEKPAQVRASHILVAGKADADKLIAELGREKNDLPRVFREKARTASIDAATKERGGDLGYFSKPEEKRAEEPDIPKSVILAAWKIEKVGEVFQEPVQTDKGFHVVMLTNKRPELKKSFESVKRSIEDKMLREKRREVLDQFIATLREKAEVKINEENLKKLTELNPQEEGNLSVPFIPMPAGRQPPVKP